MVRVLICGGWFGVCSCMNVGRLVCNSIGWYWVGGVGVVCGWCGCVYFMCLLIVFWVLYVMLCWFRYLWINCCMICDGVRFCFV